VIARGLDGLAAQGEKGMGVLRPPDGEDEALRLAAVRAALESGDTGLQEALKAIPPPPEAARTGWLFLGMSDEMSRGDGRLPPDQQLAAEALAARAVLGDAEAAPALLRTAIRQRLAVEALLDGIQLKWPTTVTPAEVARRKRQAEALGPRQALRRRLDDAVARLPASSYPAVAAWGVEAAAAAKRPVTAYPVLAGRVNEGSGEVPMECLMAALADRGEPLPPAAAEALRQLGAQTVMPEIRTLCAIRAAR